MKPKVGMPVQFWSAYGGGVTEPEAALITAVIGERVNLVHWTSSGMQQIRHDVTQSKGPMPGCWSPLPVDEPSGGKR